ncbi:MAG: LodA/GoxA family CTQ-dependent oxidase [Caldilineales bacterium]|nr:LodA/GoxA family CTQ-dependent oxidase [Caldilineales bacterium]
MKYKIFPPIGIARIGNSDEYFIGPEWPGSRGIEIDDAGIERDVQAFKDNQFRVKKQAARFRIFEFADDSDAGTLFELPDGAQIKWHVHLVNKKSAINRPGSPPRTPTVPQLAKTKGDKVLDGGQRSIQGESATPVTFTTGILPAEPHPSYLGEIRTDGAQNLMVLGGKGKSVGQGPINSFYTNRDWFDDVSDGPVRAEIVASDGSALIPIEQIEPAWVVVGPPDFAPTVTPVVTLYDVLFQVGDLQLPGKLSFTQHVYPLIKRASDLHWVNDVSGDPTGDPDYWSLISNDYQSLSDASDMAQDLRKKTAALIRNQPLSAVTLRDFQLAVLKRWEAGEVQDDWAGTPSIDRDIAPPGLTRAALEACVGQGFYPGIEAGIIVTLKDLYNTPFDFRFDHTKLSAGDVTALMALPWQADFWACATSWWPTQRPDIIRGQANAISGKEWTRSIGSYEDMVEHVNNLGFALPTADGQGFTEVGRDDAQLAHLHAAALGAGDIRVPRKRGPRRKRVG